VKFVRGFGQFWYDFIIGDDWKIAAAVVIALGVGAVAVSQAAHDAAWLGPFVGGAVMLAFSISLYLDVRR
jgi:hypothetical protein